MEELLTILAMAGTPIGLTLAWVRADEWLACREPSESEMEPR